MTDHVTDHEKAIPSCASGEGEGRKDAPARPKPPPEIPMSYYVNGGILLTFPTATSKQRQQDILNSLLFAQLASDKGYRREIDPEGWYTYFQYVLRNIGWILTKLKFDVDVSDGYFVFSSLALNLMAKNGSTNGDIVTFRRFFNALHNLPDTDPSIEILYGKIYDQDTHATSLILCSFRETADEGVELDIVMLGFGGLAEEAHRYLFHVYDSKDVTFAKAESCSMVLNQEVFEKVRETVIEKLGDQVETFIREVKIPN